MARPTVAVLDTGRGNLFSVRSALEYLGAEVVVCEKGDDLAASGAERIVLPGVGAFADGMTAIRHRDFVEPLEAARAAGVPVIGLCLGMQLLARSSSEGGVTTGLGWIDADVVRLDRPGLRVPHTGWNAVTPRPDSPLFSGVRSGADFYFVHSYHVVCDDPSTVDATVDHGGPLTAAIRVGNVAGVQFHPEKSQEHGLKVLRAFLSWRP